MRFSVRRAIVGGAAADADPRANPELVKDEHLFEVPHSLRNSDSPARRLLFALEGTAGQSASVEVYALDEPTDPGAAIDTVPEPGQSAARRFYQATTAAVAVPVGALREFTLNKPGPGKVYVRVTVVPAANATLLIASD